jgi:hypothetical protein
VIETTFLGPTATYRLAAPDGFLIAQTQGETTPLAPGTEVEADWGEDAAIVLDGGLR